MPMNAASAYQKTNVTTASPVELTLMLYDGAIKFCNIALTAMKKNEIEKCSNNIIKAEKIITEFMATLDDKYEVAQDFERVYAYIYLLLQQANMKKDTELLQRALDAIREMRDTWKEVMKISKT